MDIISTENTDVDTTVVDDIPIEMIQSALTYQITKYGLSSATNSRRCMACMANSIVRHLETLVSHKSISENQVLRLAYKTMLIDWERIKWIHDRQYADKNHPKYYH